MTHKNTIEPNTSSIYVWFQKDIMAWYTPSQMLHLFAHLCPSINRVAKFSREGDFGMSNNSSQNRTVRGPFQHPALGSASNFIFLVNNWQTLLCKSPNVFIQNEIVFCQTNLQALLSCTAMNQTFLFLKSYRFKSINLHLDDSGKYHWA